MGKLEFSFRKSIIPLLLSVALCFTATPMNVIAETDELANHWAKDVVDQWVENGWISGYQDNTIRPDNRITRAEFCTTVNNAFGFEEEADENFSDVEKTDWFYSGIMKAAFKGYIGGYKDKTIRPNNFITREEVAVILVNLHKLDINDSEDLELGDSEFISSWSEPFVKAVVKNGLMKGYENGTFGASDYITRAEAIVSLDNVINNLLKEDEVVEEIKKPSNGGGSSSYNNVIPEYSITGFEVSDVRVTQEGNKINDHQLGFRNPANTAKESELKSKFSGWLLMYSSKDIVEVWTHLTSLTAYEISDYVNTSGTNRMYRITNYGWADGGGNTFRANQKDVVTGSEFLPNKYNLYVATQTSDGIVALAQADKTINIAPYPKSVVLSGDGSNIEEYSLEFESFDHADILYNVMFYSKETIYENNLEAFAGKTEDEVKALIADGKLKKIDRLNGTENFDVNQLSLEGEFLGEDIYYTYVAAVGSTGVLGVTYAKNMIVTKEAPSIPNDVINGGRGTVFAVGGATDASNYEYMRSLFTNDKSNPPKVAVFSSSRDDFATVINHYYYDDPIYGTLKKDWESRGFKPVFIPLAIDNREYIANSEYYANLVKSCDAVWLQGGDQNKHAKSLLNDDGTDSRIMEAIRFVHGRGGVIAGTSAGMHVMSQNSFGYGNTSVAMQENDTEFRTVADIPTSGDLFPMIDNNNLSVPGINIMPENVLNDTHFDARGRLGRVLVGLKDTKKAIGIGCDEGTGLSIKDNVGTVNGVHGVFIVDVSGAIYESGDDFGVTGVKVHYLINGDTYDFDTGAITIANIANEIVGNSEAVYDTAKILDKYETTKAMISLVNSTRAKADYTSAGFKLEFRKTSNTKGYVSANDYRDSVLGGYKATSIINLEMSVEKNLLPINVIDVETNGDYGAIITFDQDLKVGYVGSSNYLNEEEEATYFVDILRGAESQVQGNSSLKIIDGKKLAIVLKSEDFANNDVIVIKTTVKASSGVNLREEVRYTYTNGSWDLEELVTNLNLDIVEGEAKEKIQE